MSNDAEIRKVVKGMATYFSDVKKIELGRSKADFLLLNVPPACNYRCKKCFTSAESRTAVTPLTLKEWFHLIDEAKKIGVKNISILGEGEPLVYKDIKEIISHINKVGIVPMIATNARMLTSEMADFLFDNNVTVGFSLDTMDAQEYNEACGGNADFVKVMENIEYTRKKFAEDIQIENNHRVYRFLLHMTVTPKNYYKLNQLRDFCAEDIFFDCQPLANVGIAETNNNFFGKEMNYEQFQNHGHKMYKPMVLSQSETGREVCCLFYYGMAINHSGEVMFDAHAIEPQKYIGNIRDHSMEELLGRLSTLRQYFLKSYKSGYCPVRDAAYGEFLTDIKNKSKDFLWPSNN